MELEEEMRLLARDRARRLCCCIIGSRTGRQAWRSPTWRARLVTSPGQLRRGGGRRMQRRTSGGSSSGSGSGARRSSSSARQRRETKLTQRAANAVHARLIGRAANQRELRAAARSSARTTTAAAATISKAQMSEPEPATRLRPWAMARKARGARGWQWICFEIEMKRSPPVA